jgi:hypothetical protein
VVQLLQEAFNASISNAAKAEVNNEAQQIIQSVGAMLKNLNAQLMQCIEEVAVVGYYCCLSGLLLLP